MTNLDNGVVAEVVAVVVTRISQTLGVENTIVIRVSTITLRDYNSAATMQQVPVNSTVEVVEQVVTVEVMVTREEVTKVAIEVVVEAFIKGKVLLHSALEDSAEDNLMVVVHRVTIIVERIVTLVVTMIYSLTTMMNLMVVIRM